MKKISINSQTKVLRILYLIALTLSVVLVFAILFTRTTNNKIKKSKNYISIDDQFTLSPNGNDHVDITELGKYFDSGSDTLSIYWTIPYMEYDRTLIFRTKDVYCDLYINGHLKYSTQNFESPMYTASPGNNWNFFTIPSNNHGQVVEFRIKYVYDTSAVTSDHFFWGQKSDWILDFLISKAFAIFLSLLIIMVGIFILFLNKSTFEKTGKHSFLYLGIYAILMGFWSLLETNTMQIIFYDGRLIQLADNLLMVTDSLPLLFYLDAEYDIFKSKWLRLIAGLDIIYIFVAVIGQFSGLTDLHNLLVGSWATTALVFIILFSIFAKQIIALLHGDKIKKNIIIQIIGILSQMILVIISLPIYINSDGMDRAQSIRFGMLIMVIMFGVAGQVQTYELIKQGTRYDIVKNLAYQDALTGLNNRTSYLEALEKYRITPPTFLGMIFFDVNNLKTANDSYGHEVGDQLICSAAEVIKDSFGKYGHAYRTGGDEFIVFLDNNDPMQSYKDGLALFNKKISTLNKLHKFPFAVEIAHGFAMREDTSDLYLQLMIETADNKMYENKRQLKNSKQQMNIQ